MIHEIPLVHPESLGEDKREDTLTQKTVLVFSWIKNNYPFLIQAKNQRIPLFDRIKGLVTFAKNLDVFYMHQVSLLHQIDDETFGPNSEFITDTQLLTDVFYIFTPVLEELNSIWTDEIIPALRDTNVILHTYDTLHAKQKIFIRNFFHDEIFPILTPMAFDKSHPFPVISNNAVNLAITINDYYAYHDHFVRIKVPSDMFPRLIHISDIEHIDKAEGLDEFIFLEEIIIANLDLLFPGVQIATAYPFRVTRDMQAQNEREKSHGLDLEADSRSPLGLPVRIEVSSEMDRMICGVICDKLTKYSRLFYRTTGPVGIADIECLLRLDRLDASKID